MKYLHHAPREGEAELVGHAFASPSPAPGMISRCP
jgi:hypothetical protein